MQNREYPEDKTGYPVVGRDNLFSTSGKLELAIRPATLAFICIDDGKANVANHSFMDGMSEMLDRAGNEAKAVVLHGRPGMFSAGLDLKELQKGPSEATALANRGMELLTRVYAHPQPVVAACDGHAVGLGAFLLLAADVRLGSARDYHITLPETALGMGFTPVLMTLVKDRIARKHQTIAVLQSKPHRAEEAVSAGFLDGVVEQDCLLSESQAWAEQLGQMPGEAYAMNKEDLRSQALKIMRESLA